MLAHLISCFQSKTQKQQNTKQTLVPEGRISQNIPQLDQSCEDTPCNFWPKMLGHLNVDDFVVGNQNIDRISLSNLYDPVALNLMLLLFLAPSWADPSWKQAAALVMNQIKTLARNQDVFEHAFGLDLKKTANKRHDLPARSYDVFQCPLLPS